MEFIERPLSYLWKGLEGILALVYPELCIGCDLREKLTRHPFCLACHLSLPFIRSNEDILSSIIGKERFPDEIVALWSLLYFTRGGKVQEMLHKIKYKNRPDIARVLGECLGEKMKNYNWKDYIIVPVPLHRTKENKRGYNQADIIGKAISSKINVAINSRALERTSNDESLTTVSKMERVQQLNTAFSINRFEEMREKNILIVDDVITTGTTVEACVNALRKYYKGKISIASLSLSV